MRSLPSESHGLTIFGYGTPYTMGGDAYATNTKTFFNMETWAYNTTLATNQHQRLGLMIEFRASEN